MRRIPTMSALAVVATLALAVACGGDDESIPESGQSDANTEGGADAVLAASIFHFGEHTVGDAKAALAAAGLSVRL